MDLNVIITVLVLCAIVGAVIGSSKSGGAGTGAFMGFILGPIGVLIVAVSKPAEPAQQAGTLQRIQARPGAAGWHPDPLGRHAARYFDGNEWTQHVGRVNPDGSRQTFEDPV